MSVWSMRGVSGAFLLGALALSGCGSDDPEFEYGRADMEAEVFGTWSGDWWVEGEPATTFTLEIRGGDEPARSLSCEHRQFSSSGEVSRGLACGGGSSTLALSATLTIDDGSEPDELDGWFEVYGYKMGNGSLWFEARNLPWQVMANQHEGEWYECRMQTPNALEPSGSCRLARVE